MENNYIGKVIGKYVVVKKLGEGNMGFVFLVRDTSLGKEYAMKYVYNNGDNNENLLALKKECELLIKLKDRRIPYVTEFIENDEYSALIMEYIEGENFEEFLVKNGRLKMETAVNYIKQIADIVSFLHLSRPSVIYRDLKPANFILTQDNKLRLLDFGTGITGYGNIESDISYGTYGYCSPEQLAGNQLTTASDVYSIGIILFYMLTAINPASAAFDVNEISNLINDYPDEIRKLIEKSISISPGMRYQNANILKEELNKINISENKKEYDYFLYYTFLSLVSFFTDYSLWTKNLNIILMAIASIVVSLLIRNTIDNKHLNRNFIKKRVCNILFTEKKNIGLNL